MVLVRFKIPKFYKYVSTCTYMSDRKHMKKLREKRIDAVEKQIARHEGLIQNEKGRLDTTKDYQKNGDEYSHF